MDMTHRRLGASGLAVRGPGFGSSITVGTHVAPPGALEVLPRPDEDVRSRFDEALGTRAG